MNAITPNIAKTIIAFLTPSLMWKPTSVDFFMTLHFKSLKIDLKPLVIHGYLGTSVPMKIELKMSFQKKCLGS